MTTRHRISRRLPTFETPTSYKFHHKATGRQLLDTQTLADADVTSGDVLRLQPEITAGASRFSGTQR